MSASFVMVTIGDIGFGYSFAFRAFLLMSQENMSGFGLSFLMPAMSVCALAVFGFT